MTTSRLTMTNTNQTSARYNQLLNAIDKALSESRNAFSTGDAIEECYGEDASMFQDGGDGTKPHTNNVLASAIDAMVDRVEEKLRGEILEFLERERVQERLARVESIIDELDKSDQEQKQADADDRQSVRDALNNVLLPKDVFPAGIIRYQAYKLMEKELHSLKVEIANVENETQHIDDRIRKHEGQVDQGNQSIRDLRQNLQTSAVIVAEFKSQG